MTRRIEVTSATLRATVGLVICACCGQDYDERLMGRLGQRQDVRVCRDCLEQVLTKIGVSSTPILPVLNIGEAVRFYEAAGFGVRVYDSDAEDEPGFAFVDFDGQSVFDLDCVERMEPTTNGAGCFLITSAVDEWHARMAKAGLPVTPIRDEPWGMREFTLTDPNGNHVRVGRGVG